MKRVTEN